MLEASARKIQAQTAWNDGWIAIRKTLRYDRNRFNKTVQSKLRQLEKLLRPSNLLDQARTFALSAQHRTLDLADDFDENEDASAGWRRAEETTRKIGAQVAQSANTLKALLPDLVSTHGSRLHAFGRGLADGCSNKHKMFNILRDEIENTSPEKRQINLFLGFLSVSAESDPSFYHSTLDALIRDDVLGHWFPIFQTTSTIDQRGLERLHEALAFGKAQIDTFQYLAWGRAHASINDDELARLLKTILSKEGGIGVTIEILQMRFHGRHGKSQEVSDSLLGVARDVLSIYPFGETVNSQANHDDDLAEIARICLKGKNGIPAVTQVGQKLANALMDKRVFAFDYPRLLDSLAQAQPIVFLDVFLGDYTVDDNQRSGIFSNNFVRHGNSLNQIPDGDLLSWCEKDSTGRYPIVASAIQAFTKSGETGKLEWKPVVYDIFERAPDLEAVLEHLATAIRPRSWSGSLADILLERVVLFEELYDHDNAEIRGWARVQYSDFQESIRKQREWENQRGRERNESFE